MNNVHFIYLSLMHYRVLLIVWFFLICYGFVFSIEGYGIAYTGIGDVGCFKLVIQFGECTPNLN